MMSVTCTMISVKFNPNPKEKRQEYFKDCEPPCWLGIKPGITTMQSALEYLENSVFVEKDGSLGFCVENPYLWAR